MLEWVFVDTCAHYTEFVMRNHQTQHPTRHPITMFQHANAHRMMYLFAMLSELKKS